MKSLSCQLLDLGSLGRGFKDSGSRVRGSGLRFSGAQAIATEAVLCFDSLQVRGLKFCRFRLEESSQDFVLQGCWARRGM